MSDQPSTPADSASLTATSAQATADSRVPFGIDDERIRALSRTIEAEIVPRLLMSLSGSGRRSDRSSVCELPEPHDLDELARLQTLLLDVSKKH